MSIVMKFGGSSVADAACMRRAGALVRARLDQRPLVVLSAMGKTTNALFRAASTAQEGEIDRALALTSEVRAQHRRAIVELFDKVPDELADYVDQTLTEVETLLRGVAILGELSPRSLDAIVGAGERLSTRILAAHVELPWIDARRMMMTDSTFGNATPLRHELDDLAPQMLAPAFEHAGAAITQGYVGADPEGHTTTLGRGGSDYSASLFGAALGVEEVQIWTDVEGLLTCDPRLVPQAYSVDIVSAREAAELAAFGAKVLHPSTIQPAIEAGAVVTVRDTRRPGGAYTTIAPDTRTDRAATALAVRAQITMVTMNSPRMLNNPGYFAKVLAIFGHHQLDIGLIATAEVSMSVTIQPPADLDLQPLLDDLSEYADVEVARDRTIIALVGDQLKATRGVSGRYFGALSEVNVEMITQGANEINMSIVVRSDEAATAVHALHRAFFEEPS